LWGLVFCDQQTWRAAIADFTSSMADGSSQVHLMKRYDYPSIARITATNLQSPKYFQKQGDFF